MLDPLIQAGPPEAPSSIHPDITRKEAWDARQAGEVALNDPIRVKVAEGLVAGKSNKEACLAAGFSEAMTRRAANDIANDAGVKQIVRDALERAGINQDKLAQVTLDGLNAEKVIVAKEKGVITDEKFYADHTVRLKAAEIAHELLDDFPARGRDDKRGGAGRQPKFVVMDARFANIFIGDQLGPVQPGSDVPASPAVPEAGDRPGGGGRDGQE